MKMPPEDRLLVDMESAGVGWGGGVGRGGVPQPQVIVKVRPSLMGLH